MNNEVFFKCYSPKLLNFLINEKNIHFIRNGISPKSRKYYWIFLQTDQLSDALVEWKETAPAKNN